MIVNSLNAGINLFAQTMGMRGHRAFNIRLDNLFVPGPNLLGKTDEGLKLALEILNTTRIDASRLLTYCADC
jgi:alkylation response protein AidB-like acyl-CoA dehydrogenase